MFFKKTAVFTGIFTMAFCLCVGNANAEFCNGKSYKVKPGRYCWATQGYACAPGCYCTGNAGSFTSWTKSSVTDGCSKRWAKIDSELASYGVHLCPADFPNSASGSSASSSCYYTSGGTTLYYKNYPACAAGTYRPKNSGTCTTCPKDHYCPGTAAAKPSKTSDAGLKSCPSGTQSSLGAKSSSDCQKHISCSAGQYLPANSETCAACPSDSYCPGKTGMTKSSSPQGATKCTGNTVPKADNSGCEEKKLDSVQCKVGEYLPANAYACATCLANSACKGGTFKPSNANQGIESCGDGYSVSADKSKCEKNKPTSVKCSAGQYLPAGKEECAQCTSGFYCPGGTCTYSETADSCIAKCPSGQVPNSNQTDCEDAPSDAITCAAKQYLPGNKSECAPCLERHTCPGGDYVPSDKDQGIQKQAEIPLDWDKMLYGPKGPNAPLKEQCWIIIDKQKYIDCVMGGTGIVKISDKLKDKLQNKKTKEIVLPVQEITQITEELGKQEVAEHVQLELLPALQDDTSEQTSDKSNKLSDTLKNKLNKKGLTDSIGQKLNISETTSLQFQSVSLK